MTPFIGWYALLIITGMGVDYFKGAGFRSDFLSFLGRDLKFFRVPGVNIYRTGHTIYV